MRMNRRHFLAAGAPAALAGFGLLHEAPSTLAQTPAAQTATKPGERTVTLIGDNAPMSPAERTRQTTHLLETHANVDDNYLKGGSVEALETAMATMLGKEDAAFLPTGTLANNLAVRLLCGDNHHALVQHESHLYLDESDSMQVLSGINLVPLAPGKVAPTYEELAAAIDSAEHGPYPIKVGAISIESPVRRQNGASVPYAQLERIAALAKQHGIGLHWDGARSLLLSGTPDFDLRRTSALFDTVYISLYKYLGSPFGAILAGKKDLIAKCRDMRHVYGGLVRQGWQATLPALDSLPGFTDRFIQARAQAEHLLAGLQSAGGFTVDRIPDGSNICFLQIAPQRMKGLQARLDAADIRVLFNADGRMYFFINESILRRPTQQLLKPFLG
jgi:threonine aldolase